MIPSRAILLAIDSIGIDPLGHDRQGSVYSDSEFLFPRGASGYPLLIPDAPIPGALVETDVTAGLERGGMECALTYASIFSGQSAVRRLGLVQSLGLPDRMLEEMVQEQNLFRIYPDACLANAIFPGHLSFLGGSYVEDLVPHFSRAEVEEHLKFQDKPVRLTGKEQHGFAELFAIAEIIITSDHGHLEQMEFHRGHPKSKVPTWYFGPEPMAHADRLRTPEAVFQLLADDRR